MVMAAKGLQGIQLRAPNERGGYLKIRIFFFGVLFFNDSFQQLSE